MLKRNTKLIFFLVILFAIGTIFSNQVIFAETLSGSNYSIENPNFDSGGMESTSTNYGIKSSVGDNGDANSSSTNYQAQSGFIPPSFPGVPAQPTLVNTGGTLYNALDFVVATANNPSDVEYAIAISPDSFTTTYFIQADNTIGSTVAWKDYISWGSGSGGRVTGLSANITYQIKVKARYQAHTETAYSITASASTVGPNFIMTVSGVSSGVSVAGQTTTVATTATSIDYGSLVQDVVSVAAQQIGITTNASGGYVTTILQDGPLRKGGNQINPVSGTNASPAPFPTSVSTGAFGYHTTDASLCTGNVTRFAANDTYAQATSQGQEIACSLTPVTNESTYVVYKVLTGSLQAAGRYSNIITYISSGKY